MTQITPPNAVPLSAAAAVMLIDGAWITLTPGTLSAVMEPTFVDTMTGQNIAPGDTWLQFTDDQVPAVTYACPMRSVAAVKLGQAV